MPAAGGDALPGGLFGPPPGLARIAVVSSASTAAGQPARPSATSGGAHAAAGDAMAFDSPSPPLRPGVEQSQLDELIEREIEETVGDALLGGSGLFSLF